MVQSNGGCASASPAAASSCEQSGKSAADLGLNLDDPSLSSDVVSKVTSHPCYSPEGHKYARIHLPVAPACNIQCNYCNRKFDCSNESRPGVVSKLLSPAKGVQRFVKVKERIPETNVVGIAGPGDPLANPAATLATLKAAAKQDSDVHLCVSTNGLALLELVPSLVKVGVSHLTITINCIDAAIGAKIYPWIYFNHKRLRGREASQVLIDRQLAGLKAAVAAGMLVKVNTVLIPGINDHHIEALAQELKLHGALLHNIMPLISDPAHGTYFGLTGQRQPTEDEVAEARAAAGSNMAQMSHCQQCRADAVGHLGQDIDLDADESVKPVQQEVAESYLVAVATKSDVLIDQHFGHAQSFALYQIYEDSIAPMGRRDVSQYCVDNECDETESRMASMLQALEGVSSVLCARIGMTPWQALEQAGVMPSTDYALFDIQQALSALQQQWLEQGKFSQQSRCKEAV
ncbi:nitrogenase cofactor biosynthesis protein NifB [Neiella marina]|uniref:Nitrogenase cofactor biosynthesis protein NifB n=1 Tax=Neiella holothuriorum TaxID=2870530 RepID=A0ABS7EHY1_9GAMM|nr:nitrogenase cofactor biosynthesis protein NifB [Neiella holothuriorum]MBW8191961.1 nitrogenase cofactor biosynthesis protein NifB [Neiella holothuriorum]